MERLLIVKCRRREEGSSPESRYALGTVQALAREAFDDVHLLTFDAAEGSSEEPDRDALLAAAAEADSVLLLGTGDFQIGAASLGALREALEEGHRLAVPTALATTDLPQHHALYSRRSFEAAEREFLAGGQTPSRVPGAADGGPVSFPVALLRRDAFEAALKSNSIAPLPDGAVLRLPEGLSAVARGLYHRYSDYYGQERSDVLPLIPKGTRKVLEIGCARGATARLLRRQRGCEVVGVELNPEVAAEARQVLDRVIQGDIQEVELEREFDVVLALELFEHLTEGEHFLRRARQWLVPGGRIVLSVPNVGHFSVVEDLLAGRWDYLPIGLLCYTHYRFFTRKTLEDWLRRCGFEHFEIIAQKTDLPERFTSLPEAFQTDPESLATSGFFVIAHT